MKTNLSNQDTNTFLYQHQTFRVWKTTNQNCYFEEHSRNTSGTRSLRLD
jgi:hypothetical protein